MKKNIAVIGLLSLLMVPASAMGEEDYNLDEYKTVAVQPVLGASNMPGLFESQLAAHAGALEFSPEQTAAANQASTAYLDGEDEGFGFAGKAKQSDVILLMLGNTMGMLPTLMKVNPEGAKQRIPTFKGYLGKIEGMIDPTVSKALNLATLQAASMNDFQNTTKALILGMAASSAAIKKGSERAHGYMATGLYSGLATLFAASGKPNKTYADLAAPLVMYLEQDAALGGADRAVAAQLKLIAGQLTAAQPNLNGVMGAIKAMNAVKPD